MPVTHAAPQAPRMSPARRDGNRKSTATADAPALAVSVLRPLVLEALAAGPRTLNQLFDVLAAKGPIGYATLRIVVGALVSEGRIVKQPGATPTAGGIYALRQGVTSAAPVRAVPVPDPAVRIDQERLATAIGRVLASGASYDPREVKRNIHEAYPSIEMAPVVEALDRLVAAGAVERIPLGTTTRYRKRARVKEIA